MDRLAVAGQDAPAGFAASESADEDGGAGPAASAPHALDKQQFEAMTKRLAERLAANPGDANGWTMLGRSYLALGQEAEAVAAYARWSNPPQDAGALATTPTRSPCATAGSSTASRPS